VVVLFPFLLLVSSRTLSRMNTNILFSRPTEINLETWENCYCVCLCSFSSTNPLWWRPLSMVCRPALPSEIFFGCFATRWLASVGKNGTNFGTGNQLNFCTSGFCRFAHDVEVCTNNKPQSPQGVMLFFFPWPWHTCHKVTHKPNQPTTPPHVTRCATYGLFFRKLDFWIQNSKFPAKNSQQLKTQPFLIRINWFDSTHNQAVETARMSSETAWAPVSEPVYDYSDDKHVPTAACVERWTLNALTQKVCAAHSCCCLCWRVQMLDLYCCHPMYHPRCGFLNVLTLSNHVVLIRALNISQIEVPWMSWKGAKGGKAVDNGDRHWSGVGTWKNSKCMYMYIYIIINVHILALICIYTKSDKHMYVYIHVWTHTAHMLARLSTRTNTYLHTHIHTHKTKRTLLFFLCQNDTLFENRVFCWKLIVGTLYFF